MACPLVWLSVDSVNFFKQQNVTGNKEFCQLSWSQYQMSPTGSFLSSQGWPNFGWLWKHGATLEDTLIPGAGIPLKGLGYVLSRPALISLLPGYHEVNSLSYSLSPSNVQAHWVNDHRLNVLKSCSQMILPALLILQQNKLTNQEYPLLSWCLSFY